MSNSPLFIIGMHRSGTTLLTRLVSKMGWFMGEHRDTNEETHMLIHCNEQIMERARATWDAPLPTLELFQPEMFARHYPAFLRTLTLPEKLFFLGERRYGACKGHFSALNERWGAKDPRCTFTLPFWKHLLPPMKIIHIVRHGVDVAASLRRRHRQMIEAMFTARNLPLPGVEDVFHTGIVRHTSRCLSLEYRMELWKQYVEMGRMHVAAFGADALEVKFEDLLAEPERHLKRIADFIGPEKTPDFAAIAELVRKEKRFSYEQDAELLGFAKQHDVALRGLGY